LSANFSLYCIVLYCMMLEFSSAVCVLSRLVDISVNIDVAEKRLDSQFVFCGECLHALLPEKR